MSDAAAITLFVGSLVIILGALFCLQQRIATRRRAERAARVADFERRLRSPDLAAVEEHLGHALPQCLHALYQDQALVLSDDILIEVPNPATRENECYIAWFGPGDIKNVTEQPWPGCEGLFKIGNNGAGDQFLVDPRKVHPEVIYYLHESAQKRGIGVSLSAFLSAKRRPVPDEYEA
jgi:hypothetical protein